jgi:hypothetical protein
MAGLSFPEPLFKLLELTIPSLKGEITLDQNMPEILERHLGARSWLSPIAFDFAAFGHFGLEISVARVSMVTTIEPGAAGSTLNPRAAGSIKYAVERSATINGPKILPLHRSGCGAVNDLTRIFRAVIVWMTPALPPRRPEIPEAFP